MVRDTSNNSRAKQPASLDKNQPKDFQGAAIINEDGSETPITEAMVQSACKKLDKVTPGAGKSD